ncbi:MAG: SpoIIE family protein phosphatase [Candidatus Hatepunaea meridiana]|nr:SpoIIE family protein phosphatase [Candidatus Hatepunaea meridiana]
MSLRTKLLILSVILALIPLSIASLNMIKITQDELIESANFKLITVASHIQKDIDVFYRSACLGPVYFIKNAIEDENLGIEEKLSILKEGSQSLPHLAALQISVEGSKSPLLVMQNSLKNQLKASSLDPVRVLELSSDKIAELKKKDGVFIGDVVNISNSDVWLITIILPLDSGTFEHPATLSARINLLQLKESIANRPFTKIGQITIVDPDGHKLFDSGNPDLSGHKMVTVAKDILASDSRSIRLEHYKSPSGEAMLGACAFPEYLDWRIIIELSEAVAYSAVDQMYKSLIKWLIFGFTIAIIGAIILAISLTRPLRKLKDAATEIAHGNLDTHVTGKTRKDEIGELAQAFNKMVDDLKHYVEELTTTTAAKERAEKELELAWTIQKGFLPKSFPDMKEIDVWGTCEPAREVGGDYFDFFRIDDEHYGLVVGDVSGKGVPAALYMAVSRTLFRMLSSTDCSPDEVMTEFNDRLVELDEGSNMFITFFYGMYNVRTGRLLYSSAGHNMPFVKLLKPGRRSDIPPTSLDDDQQDADTAIQKDESFRMLPDMKTLVAGMFDGFEMPLAETNLSSGDIILLYTDGITEPVNKNAEEFGEERLAKILDANSNLSSQGICEKLIVEVRDFQAGMPQFDDMTVFMMKVK